jgi:FSR family fosmidomycin resistance protein-like MFS transporter
MSLKILLDALFLAVGLGHLGVDFLNGAQTVLLTYLAAELALSNTALGAIGTTYTVSGALGQPVFGYLSDRIGGRVVVAGGVLWMAIFYSLAVTLSGWVALVCLILASVGSGAFHPAGAMLSTQLGRTRFNRETTTTSYFFLFGQAGLSLGPLVGGILLAWAGPPGLLILTAIAVPVGLNAAWRLKNVQPAEKKPKSAGRIQLRYGWGVISTLMLLSFFRLWAQQNFTIFIPKYLSDLGYTPNIYGLATALFMGGVAIGGVAGGNLADRFGKRRVAMWSQMLAFLPMILIPFVPPDPWYFILLPLGGLLSGAAHSVIIVFAQGILPGGMGLASGLILGFMFSTGALGVFLSGFIADSTSLPLVFGLSALLILSAGLLSRVLKDEPALA